MSDAWTQISGYSPQDYTDTLTYKVHSATKQVEKVTGQALERGGGGETWTNADEVNY